MGILFLNLNLKMEAVRPTYDVDSDEEEQLDFDNKAEPEQIHVPPQSELIEVNDA